MLKKILALLLVLIISGGLTWWFVKKEKNVSESQLFPLWVNDAELQVELAQSQGARAQGLGDRESLPQNQGMLFVFDKSGTYPFWMRDMKFPLDIVWIDSNNEVVDIVKNADPASYPNSFTPKKEALYVLEVNAGWADKNNIKIGSKAIFAW